MFHAPLPTSVLFYKSKNKTRNEDMQCYHRRYGRAAEINLKRINYIRSKIGKNT